jgi:hypothetical protein
MGRRIKPRCRFYLSAVQSTTIDRIARNLTPNQRHSFLLRVSRNLRLSANPPGFVSDVLVSSAIDCALAELEIPA